ncbi:MAG: tandem-95 repeat protein, partial [Rheinheimera sp.]|nr:tandem-95 repeat protein [Rheinheimera sp.]
AYVLKAADFGFSDVDGNALSAVIVNAPTAGTLSLNGVVITGAVNVSISDINAGKLVFTPALNANGSNYSNISFQVQDNGGTANGGANTDPTPNNITFNVTPVDDATVVARDSATTNEDTAVTIDVLANDYDVDGPKSPVKSVTQGTNGSVTLNPDGTVTYTPNANFNGPDSFTYTNTEGATATVSVTVNPVNDAPSGADKTITTAEDTAYVLKAADFGFSDVDGNAFSGVIINKPSAGTLSLNGVVITGATNVSISDINAGKLIFTPALNASGSGYGSVSFQVQDNGGTANGGVNTDPTPNNIIFNVTPVADAIPGSDVSVVIGAPVVNQISFVSDGGLNGKTEHTFGNGITISTGGNGVFNWSGGNNLGVNSPGDNGTDAQRIEDNEAIHFKFPTGMQYLALKLKNSADDVVKISSELEPAELQGQSTLSGVINTSSSAVVSAANLKVEVQLEVTNSSGVTSTVTRIATVNTGGSWSVNLSGISGTVTKATVNATMDGGLFNQGGNESANVTYSVSADMSSLSIGLGAANAFNASAKNNGFQIEYVAVDPNPSGQTSYTYPVDLFAAIQDTVGVAETFSSLSLSDLPAGSSLSVVLANGSYVDIMPNAQGQFDLSAFTGLLSTPTTVSGTDKLYLISNTPLPAGFSPTVTIEVADGASVAKTIIGGSASSALNGGEGNDYIDGGSGNDTITGGAGNDILLGGSGNDILTGGAGADVFAWRLGEQGTSTSAAVDRITDFNLAQGDVLNVADLLQGESLGNISQFLSFNFAAGNTTVNISHTGSGAVTQQIVLEGVDLTALGSDSQSIINALINNGNLKIDG